MLQQLQSALSSKPQTDPYRDMLRALTAQSNKTTGPGGVNILKPDILKKLQPEVPEGGINSRNEMSAWLARFSKEDEGESILRFNNGDQEGECKHTKIRSGMLDKATMNIRQKQVWPQKNLGEDWADEDLFFKQIRFMHLVAGASCTIEIGTDPGQILGCL